MNIQTIDKSKGFLSLAWVAIGLVWWVSPIRATSFSSEFTFMLATYGAWWGVALLLAGTGLCGGSRANKLAGLVTICGFIFFALWIPRIHT